MIYEDTTIASFMAASIHDDKCSKLNVNFRVAIIFFGSKRIKTIRLLTTLVIERVATSYKPNPITTKS